jgi:hypothetical protein
LPERQELNGRMQLQDISTGGSGNVSPSWNFTDEVADQIQCHALVLAVAASGGLLHRHHRGLLRP